MNEVLFLVSPNFGLLDNWLPVLTALKEKERGIAITAIFPKVETVSEMNPAEMMVQLGEVIFTKVIFKSRGGFWVTAHSLVHAKELSGKSPRANLIFGKMRTMLRLSRKAAFMKPMIDLGDAVLSYLAPIFTREKHVKLSNIGSNIKAICFDVYAKTKKEAREVLDQFPETPRFSIWHGVGISDFKLKGGTYDEAHQSYKTTAYLLSRHEISAYKENYGLKESELKIVGVPRYEPEWIETVLEKSKKDIPDSWSRYLFVVSRPASDHFFPREKKKEALGYIKKLASELRSKIVIKLRLSEYSRKDGIYEEILGEDSYGKEWIYSSSHPFVLGKDSLFGITFYSGVAVDLLAIGVPVVQMVQLESGGKSGYIMPYVEKGLVLGARSYEELKINAENILHRKNATLAPLRKAYDEFFRPIGKPITVITNDILKTL
ncbi:MAG: hypothetical protein AAB518_04330 [Patescibacteria group bacterium]